MTIENILDQLDMDWPLPAYRLEPAAAPFFRLFLLDVLEEHCGRKFARDVIPEFPLRQGALWPNRTFKKPNESKKVDYAVFDKDRQDVVFAELKTDMVSLKPDQAATLKQASQCELRVLVDGIIRIRLAPDASPKYDYLLHRLEGLGLVCCTDSEWKNLAPQVGVKPRILYIQPKADKAAPGAWADHIYFEEFACRVEGRGEVGRRFAESLRKWAS